MISRQQRRAEARASSAPTDHYAPDFLESVNILRRLDPVRLRMAVAMLAALETSPKEQLLRLDASATIASPPAL